MKESEFSRYFTGKLKEAGFMVDRIETHSTVVGIPDIHIVGHGDEYWLELKSCPKMKFIGSKQQKFKIPWRPGQRAWATLYFVRTLGKCSLTVVRMQDSICFIPMDEPYTNDMVARGSMLNFEHIISKDARTLVFIMRYMTQQFDWDVTVPARENIVRWVEQHLKMCAVDYDPNALWEGFVDEPVSTIEFNAHKLDMFKTLLWTFINSTTK